MSLEKILKPEEKATFKLRELYKSYGFLPFEMSRFEEYDLYFKNKDFLVSAECITFLDKNGRLLALKPDVTLSIIKNSPEDKKIQKLYYDENVFRINKGETAFKEILQAGLECFGDIGRYEIAEVLLLAVKSLEMLGKNFVLDISDMSLISAAIKSSKLSSDGEKKYLNLLKQKNSHEFLKLAQEENLDETSTKKLLSLINLSGSYKKVIESLKPLLIEEEEKSSLNNLSFYCSLLEKSGYKDCVKLDFSALGGMKYYNGVVFKGYIENVNDSVLSGGQYDNLLLKMGRNCKGIGFALYLDLIKEIEEKADNYDFDTLLVYDDNVKLEAVFKKMEELSKEGSVRAAKELSKENSYRRALKFDGIKTEVLYENR